MNRLAPKILLLAGAALALAACGKVGELDRPGPLWGDKAKADWAAQQKAAADAQAQKDAKDQSERGHPAPVSPDSAPSDGPSAPPRPQ